MLEEELINVKIEKDCNSVLVEDAQIKTEDVYAGVDLDIKMEDFDDNVQLYDTIVIKEEVDDSLRTQSLDLSETETTIPEATATKRAWKFQIDADDSGEGCRASRNLQMIDVDDSGEGCSTDVTPTADRGSGRSKRRRLDGPGRTSYKSTLNDYVENLVAKQTVMINNAMSILVQSQKDMMEKATQDLMKWEEEMMKKEHDFQREQADALSRTIRECLWGAGPPENNTTSRKQNNELDPPLQ